MMDRRGHDRREGTQQVQLDWVELEVSNQPTIAAVDIKWPSMAILKTKQLRGSITKGLMSSHNVPLKNNTLALRNLVDYKEIAVTTTTDDGTFEFRNVPPGLYFLQIRAKESKTDDFYKPEGNIAIDVGTDSTRNTLAISTSNSSCGLSYDLEENKGRYKPEACFKGGKPVQCDY